MELLWLAIMLFASLLALGMALLTLPGVWFLLIVAGGVQWWGSTYAQTVFPVWLLVTCVAIALLGEVLELVASAYGSKKAGGSRSAAIGSIFGAIIGAIIGTFVPPPPLGTVIGSAIGAGLFAMLLQRYYTGSTMQHSTKVGIGAAAGRLAATLIKVSIVGLVGMSLIIAAMIHAIWG